MFLYTLDPNDFSFTGVIDQFVSLIWTERYSDTGEIALTAASNKANRDFYKEGMFFWKPGAKDVALIDSVLDQDGVLQITGEFLTGFLKQRLFRDTWSTDKSAWKLTGAAGAIANTIISEMITGSGRMATGSVLPGSYGTYEAFPNVNILAPPAGTSTTVAIDYGTVYDAVKQACDADSLGFRFYPTDVSSDYGAQMTFEVYQGRDLTSDQVTYPVVAFDPAMDTLANTSALRSIAGYKTAAYAWANGITDQSQIGVAFAAGTSGLNAFQRRSLMVDASDINAADYTSAELTSILNRRAKNGLANNNYVRMSDGQIVPQSAFKYGTDYNLGDIVELRNSSSVADQARIIEYIYVQDNTGESAYPTLSVI